MKKIFTVLAALFTSICLVGCSQPVTKQDVGTVSGAVLGGLVGSQFGRGSGQLVGVGVGTLLGAYIGGAIGKNMDDTDKMKMSNALETKPIGKPAYWRNANTGNNYKVTPVRNVSVQGNPYCREYRTTANIGGQQQQMYGTACRQPDGSWKMVSSKNN